MGLTNEGNGRRARGRLRQPSTGLIAMSAVVLAASAASSSASLPVSASAPPETRPTEPVGAESPPPVEFPVIRKGSASARFVGALPVAAGTGIIPSVVLDAYRRAAERTNLAQPGCHIPLELLAAIGKVESGHARGGQVDATGRTVTLIMGPVLNGGPFAAIADTDGGTLDEDPVWDRAVGPMQFIPGTWARWAADGNNDGRLDPHNVYDASLAAARYLCAANRDLGTPAGLDEAVLSYNHSTSYLALVRSWMNLYQSGTVPIDTLINPVVLPQETDPAPTATTTPVATPTPAPTTPPSTTPPPAPTPPTTPPTPPTPTPPTPPLPTTPPTRPPLPTMPPFPEPPVLEPPVTDPPVTEPPAQQCGLPDVVDGLVSGLLGESPGCVQPLELSTQDTSPVVTP